MSFVINHFCLLHFLLSLRFNTLVLDCIRQNDSVRSARDLRDELTSIIYVKLRYEKKMTFPLKFQNAEQQQSAN